jgi:hypothetical protein
MGHLRSTVSLLIAVSFVAGAGRGDHRRGRRFADADWELVSHSFRSTGALIRGLREVVIRWSGSSVAENCYHGLLRIGR